MTNDMWIRNIKYRTSDGRADYRFDFAYIAAVGTWRIYIRSQPSYGGRPEGAIDSHRLTDSNGQFICWQGRLNTVSEAQGVAGMWADCTQHYIATGHFGPPPSRAHVQDRSPLADWAYAETPATQIPNQIARQLSPTNRPATPRTPTPSRPPAGPRTSATPRPTALERLRRIFG